jgi:hypothetical protein
LPSASDTGWLWTTRSGGDNHLGVLLVPQAHVDEIRVFRVQHLAKVGIALGLGNAEEVAEFATCVRMRVSQSAKRLELGTDR